MSFSSSELHRMDFRFSLERSCHPTDDQARIDYRPITDPSLPTLASDMIHCPLTLTFLAMEVLLQIVECCESR